METDVGFVETHYVIANMNPQDAYTKLLDKRIPVPEREIKRANAESHGVRFFNAYVALNKSVEELGIKDYTIFMPGSFDTKKNYEYSKSYDLNTHSVVVIYNVVNPDASPKGTTVMTFTITYTEDVWGGFSQREYVAKKQELFRKVMENFENDTGIIIHDCIEEIEMASPWTFCRFLGTPQGTVYGYECNEWGHHGLPPYEHPPRPAHKGLQDLRRIRRAATDTTRPISTATIWRSSSWKK